MYIMTKFLAAWHSRKTKQIFEIILRKLEAHLVMLLLVPFASKLQDSSNTESLKILWKSTFRRFRSKIQAIVEFSLIFINSPRLEFLTNLDAKGAKGTVVKWGSSFHKVFSKIFYFT